jgi:hypothetical protein
MRVKAHCRQPTALMMLACLWACTPRAPVGVGPGKGSAAAMADPWVRRPADLQHWSTWSSGPCVRISEACARVVADPKQKEAQALLSTSAWVEVSIDRARDLLGDRTAFDACPAGKVALLRCVQVQAEPHEEKARLIVVWDGESVCVTSSALRMNYAPVEHVAVVAVLPGAPKEVFVDLMTAIY